MRASKRWVIIGGAVTIACLACVLLIVPRLMLGLALEEWQAGQVEDRFNPVAWRDSAKVNAPEPSRIRMIDDLLQRYELNAMTRGEVVALLGEPDKTDKFPDWSLVYWLGPERSPFGVDSEWLVLRVGHDERVTEHRLLTD